MSVSEYRQAALPEPEAVAGGFSLRVGLRGRAGAAPPPGDAGLGALFAELRSGLRQTRIELVCGIAEPGDIPLAESAAKTGLPLTVLLPESPDRFLERCGPQEAVRLGALRAPLRCVDGDGPCGDARDAIVRGLGGCDLLWIIEDGFPPDPGPYASFPFAMTRLVSDQSGAWKEQSWFPNGHDLRGFAAWLARIEAFNADVGRLAGGPADALQERGAGTTSAERPASTPEACAGAMYRAADRLAILFQRRTTAVLLSFLAAAYLATVLHSLHLWMRFLWRSTPEAGRPWFLRPLFTLQGGDPPRVSLWWADIPYLLLVTGIVAAFFIVRRLALQRRHLEYRALAECLRIQGAWRLAGLEDRVAWEVPFSTDAELAWLGTALAHWDDGMAGSRPPVEPALREGAVEVWIDGQRAYHEAKARRSGAVATRIRRISLAALVAAIALLYVRSMTPPDHPVSLALWLVVAAGIVVAVYGRVTAVVEHARMHARSAATFADGRRILDEAAREGRPSSAAGLALRLGTDALAELAFWLRLHKERPIELPRL